MLLQISCEIGTENTRNSLEIIRDPMLACFLLSLSFDPWKVASTPWKNQGWKRCFHKIFECHPLRLMNRKACLPTQNFHTSFSPRQRGEAKSLHDS